MTTDELKTIALHIRTKLEAIPFAQELSRCSVLVNFPKDCCQVASLCFLYYLKRNRLVDSKQLFLLANAEISPGRSHAWALVDGHHVDLTADQFCSDNVIISVNDPWPDIFKQPNPYPFDDEWIMEDYEADLIRLCRFIDEPPVKKRRVRYSGKNPRRFDQKYKELNPELYADDISKIIQTGKTPAGSHRPICVQDILKILDPRPGQIALDATLGYGGHTRAILERIGPDGCLWGIDVDPIEIKRTEERLRTLGYTERQLKIKNINFAGIPKILPEVGGGFDLILADLGVSSMQLDDPKRGFTFKTEGPLDLRLNPERGQPASALIQSLSERELETILKNNADEPYAHGIARVIIKRRERILTTTTLADAIKSALPRADSEAEKEERTKSIRRTFQALRIAVNNEMIVLDQFLKILPGCLNPGGKVAILTFHSGEDNRVVRSFEEGITSGSYRARGREPIYATHQERYDNPRSKSAILRWAQR